MNYKNRESIKRILDLVDSLDTMIAPLEYLHKYLKSDKHAFVFISSPDWADPPIRMPEVDNLIENLVLRRLEVLYKKKEELLEMLLPL